MANLSLTAVAGPFSRLEARSGSGRLRIALLIGLIGLEMIWLTWRFDGTPIRMHGGEWMGVFLGRFQSLARIGICAGGATAFFLWSRSREKRREILSFFTASPSRSLAWLAVHFLWLALFGRLAILLLEEGALNGPWAWPWSIAWVSSGVLAAAAWAAALAPIDSWGKLSRNVGWAIGLGTLVGIFASDLGFLCARLWEPFGRSTLTALRVLLGLVYSDIVYQPAEAVIGTSRFAVEIMAPCSGYEGIGLIVVFFSLFLWMFRDRLRFPSAFFLLPVGAMLMWCGNLIRLWLLIILGNEYSTAVAMGGFHSQAGWLTLNAGTLGLIALATRCRWFARRESAESARSAVENPSLAYLVPLLASVATAMATRAFSSGTFNSFYPLQVLATLAALWRYRRDYAKIPGLFAGSKTAIGIGVAVFALWLGLIPAESANPIGDALDSLPRMWAAAWVAFRLVGFVFVVPLAEELAFRGFLNRRLVAADFEAVPWTRSTCLSVALSSAAFGFLHPGALAGTLAGFLFAAAVLRKGRLGDAVLAHAVANGLLAVVAVAQGKWYLL